MVQNSKNKPPAVIIKPKKSLGQHFLIDKNIAQKMVNSLEAKGLTKILEIGSGTGMLSQFLLHRYGHNIYLIELDKESINHLHSCFPDHISNIIHEDFLKFDIHTFFNAPLAIIGSFPYNISSQIFFKIYECRDTVNEVVGMIQKEVAERIKASPGCKEYGILSVLLQAFYDIEYLFTVSKHVFVPPPKVQSGVIRLTRNKKATLGCDEKLFFKLVKASFNQRRKTIRNSLKKFLVNLKDEHELLSKRPEELSVDDFIELTKFIEYYNKT